MAIEQQLLDVLACVQCRGQLVSVEGGRSLLCESCQLKFPVRDDVPLMLLEEGINMGGLNRGQAASSAPVREPVGSGAADPKVSFKIVSGPGKGSKFTIDVGTCKAVGRAVHDPHKTDAFSIDVALNLDDNTRRLIHQYVTKQFRRANLEQGTEFGFRRTTDIVIDDLSVSRLHAMFFYDSAGIGVLDLVSKNGTFVNGEEVESRLLKKGDTIEIGDTKLVLEG